MRFAFSRSSAVALTLVGGMALAGLAHAQTNAGPQNPGSAQGDTQPTGSEPPHGNPGPTRDTGAAGPIGASPQTMPAKSDDSVAARDRLPIMAHPLPLSDEQKHQIYAGVMDNSQIPTAPISAQPATILPDSVALSALPDGMEQQIPAVRGYKAVKTQDKVLLVQPSNRVVVGEISK
jgi:hypothetical protein